MPELNQMARELGVENFGTMRKHEVIFHIFRKTRAVGIMFSEGVLEVLSRASAFCARKLQLPTLPEDIYVSPSQIRRFDLQTGNLVTGQIRPPRKRRSSSRCSRSKPWTRKTRTRPRTRRTSTT